MVPEMFLHEMVGCKKEHEQHDDAKSCKKDVHPFLAQKIDAMMMLMTMSDVCPVFMAQMSCRKCRDEDGKSCKHQHAFPSVMPCR